MAVASRIPETHCITMKRIHSGVIAIPGSLYPGVTVLNSTPIIRERDLAQNPGGHCKQGVRQSFPADRHRGESHLSSPATPPDKRVRIRRFEELRSTETGDTQLIGPA